MHLQKDVAVSLSKVLSVSSGIITFGHACADYSCDGRLLPPSHSKSSTHTKPLTNWFNQEMFKNFLIFFDVSQQGLSCVLLQEVHAGAIVFFLQSWPHGSCHPAQLLELDVVVHILTLYQPYLGGIRCKFSVQTCRAWGICTPTQIWISSRNDGSCSAKVLT